jgi:arylsulfate sulfotransferase
MDITNPDKKPILYGSLSLILIITTLSFAYLTHPVKKAVSPETTQPDPALQLISKVEKIINKQNETEQVLLDEFKINDYDFENPLIIQNPYGIAPLSALVAFRTKQPVQISIHVQGKDALTSIDFSFNGFQTEHWIPVYGLYTGVETKVILTAETQAGIKNEKTLLLTTEPPIKELPHIDVISTDAQHYQPGLNFTFGEYKIVYDFHGDIRWYLTIPDTCQSSARLDNGRMFVEIGQCYSGPAVILEIDFLGRIYSAYYESYGIHHDLIRTDNGKIYLTGSGTDNFVEDLIVKMDTQNGKVEKTIDLKTILSYQRPILPEIQKEQINKGDWFHLNAIWYSKEDDTLLVSGRHQSAVVKLDEKSGAIKWILGAHDLWEPVYRKYLLTPVGENFEWSYAQHSIQIMPDADLNPDTVDLLLFDNGLQRSLFDDNSVPLSKRYSRLVIYRINEKAKTVEQLWQWGKERGYSLYTDRTGDANLLKNGNILGSFLIEHGGTYDVLIEVTSSGEVVFEAQGSDEVNTSPYRIERGDLYGSSELTFKPGEPIRNFLNENH